jgi:hypothetical protein
MRGTWPSTLACASPTSNSNPLGKGFGPARADCGFREPLAPRLARPGERMVATCPCASEADTRHGGHVGGVLGSDRRIASRGRFVRLEGAEGDDPSPDAVELSDVLLEGALRPLASTAAAERRKYLALLVPSEEGDLEMDAVAFERRVTILAVLWRVRPAISLERARDAAQILGPDRDVQVVWARVTSPAWKSTAQPPNSQYSRLSFWKSSCRDANAASCSSCGTGRVCQRGR